MDKLPRVRALSLRLYGMSWLAGIGFTTSLFIAGLAFGEGALLNQAKVAILVAAVIAGSGGSVGMTRGTGAQSRKGAVSDLLAH